MRYLYNILFAVILLASCKKSSIPVNKIGDLRSLDSQTVIRNWRLVGPFTDSVDRQWLSPLTQANRDQEDYENFKRVSAEMNVFRVKDVEFHQGRNHMDLNNVFDAKGKAASCYAICKLESTVAQDIMLVSGVSDAFKIWVNGELKVRGRQDWSITSNAFVSPVHLKRGTNEILVKLYNFKDDWAFHLDVASVKYVKEYGLGLNHYSLSSKYLIEEGEKLPLKVMYPAILDRTAPISLGIIDVAGKKVIEKKLKPGDHWGIALNGLKTGAYHCRITAGHDTLEQKIYYGNYQQGFSNIIGRLNGLQQSDLYKINIGGLQRRFHYLDSASRHGMTEIMERKISTVLFELSQIQNKIATAQDPLSGVQGLHIRAFRSSIDQVVDHYMVYVPRRYKATNKMPLVVMMPFVTQQQEFVTSWHVADLTRIEQVKALGDKFGYVVLWPSSRIYLNYNLNPIVTSATFEAVKEVARAYAIDEKRTYVYGDCSGGLAALLISNRYPSKFAAVSVKGPEMNYTKCETSSSCKYGKRWANDNNLINTAENYRNIPVFLMHAPADKKAEFSLSKKLDDKIIQGGGLSSLSESDRNPIHRSFAFFKDKNAIEPKTVKLATYQLKYGSAYWLRINEIIYPNKATVEAVIQSPDLIEIKASNIKSLSLLPDFIPGSKTGKIKVTLNDRLVYNDILKSKTIEIKLTNNTVDLNKTASIEGPINDVFSRSFLLVNGTTAIYSEQKFFNSMTFLFDKNWNANFFGGCRIKSDKAITDADIQNNNLVLFGTPYSNAVINRMAKYLPLKFGRNYVQFGNRKFEGEHLTYSFVYPNPLNPRKYVLIIGTNSPSYNFSPFKNIALKGWYDYEVWNRNKMVGSGYFNEHWK